MRTEPEQRVGTARRQARGERRIAQILDAATEVFATVGYEQATTNAIAAAAGISPGSLYQFFRNKDEIVRALAERYAAELAAVHSDSFDDPELAGSSIEVLIDRALTPLLRFNREQRAFKALFARTDMPPALTAATEPLQRAMLERVVVELTARAPGVPEAQVRRAAVVGIQITKALAPLISAAEPAESQLLHADLRRLLIAHFAEALTPA